MAEEAILDDKASPPLSQYGQIVTENQITVKVF